MPGSRRGRSFAPRPRSPCAIRSSCFIDSSRASTERSRTTPVASASLELGPGEVAVEEGSGQQTRSQFALLTERRFAPFFWTQFFGAFNNNLLKNAMIVLVTFQTARFAG